jgi:tyrosyl-tRNA synthetase
MSQVITDPNIVDDFLSRRINEVIPSKDELRSRLLSGKRLKIYQGFDPTSPNLHIGHLVGILTLKMFQDLGHEVIFLIGDFTATIGDPSGKDKTRVPLTFEQVKQNAQTYKDQVKKILNFEGENPVQVRFNSEWLSQMKLDEVLQFAMNFTAQQMIERDMFQKRLEDGKPISLHEFLYPVLVTKDALALDVDIELGGSDQLFNMSVGRHLIKSISGKNKLAVTTNLLADASGKKIGKTEGNAINIANQPEELFGQIMSLPDDAISPCLNLITLISTQEIKDIESQIKDNPMLAKKKLAWEVVKMLNTKNKADKAQQHFEKTVQGRETPQDILEINVNGVTDASDIALSHALVASKSEFRRLIEQNGIKINGQVIKDPYLKISKNNSGDIIQVGKRRFIKIK